MGMLPMPENKVQNINFTQAHKWSLVPCVHTVFISVLGQSTAKLMFQNGVRQGEVGTMNIVTSWELKV